MRALTFFPRNEEIRKNNIIFFLVVHRPKLTARLVLYWLLFAFQKYRIQVCFERKGSEWDRQAFRFLWGYWCCNKAHGILLGLRCINVCVHYFVSLILIFRLGFLFPKRSAVPVTLVGAVAWFSYSPPKSRDRASIWSRGELSRNNKVGTMENITR